MQYRVSAIPEEISNKVRATLKSPQYGHPAHVDLATGYGPCRSCLRTFNQGEEQRILFTYNPFDGLDALASPGPVFIHKEFCSRYDNSNFPPELLTLPLVFEGYGKEGWIIDREQVVKGNVEDIINRLFINKAVEYINVRNAKVGCYIARIYRAE
jgi:hypothetical protein